jgi:two-component system, OmpR family, response regulator RegX3
LSRILVVEDDDTLASGIKFTLEKEGWQVEVAHTLEAARTLFQDRLFDLILLDNNLPDGSGFDFCSDIRKQSEVPIVFLTVADEEWCIVQGLELGADDYITKPFRVKELTSRIRANLRRNKLITKQANEHFYNSGDVTVRLLEQTVFLNQSEVTLTPLEFKLISILIKHPMQVLSREQILSQMWGLDGEFMDDNTLSVNIRRLREKIERDPSNPVYIVTVRGTGYKWNYRSEQL